MYNSNVISPLAKTKALIISGAVTSGKTMLTTELEKVLQIKVINETTTGNYYKILDSINPYLYPQAIFEHCWVYKKQYLFKHLYEKNLLVILSLSPKLLRSNYQTRLSQTTKGDFSIMDPIKQQEELLNDIKNISTDFVDTDNKLIVMKINSLEGYKITKDTIIDEYTKL